MHTSLQACFSCLVTQYRGYVIALAGSLLVQFFASVTVADEGIEFFESRIRPVLVESCYECHNTAETAEADLALDWKDGIRATTAHGTVVVPGKPDKSLLLKVIRHEIPDLEMPEAGPKLDDSVGVGFREVDQDGRTGSSCGSANGEGTRRGNVLGKDARKAEAMVELSTCPRRDATV